MAYTCPGCGLPLREDPARTIDRKRNGTDPVSMPPAAPLLLNNKQLGAILGRSAGYVSAMKSFGFKYDYGRRCTLENALAWLRENPDFKAGGYFRGSPEFIKDPEHHNTKGKRSALRK